MKRKLRLLLGIILVICAFVCIGLFSACGGDDTSDPTNNPSQGGDPSQGGEPPQIDDPSQGGELSQGGATKRFEPVLDCRFENVDISIMAGTEIQYGYSVPYKATLSLYATSQDYQSSNAYSTKSVDGTFNIHFEDRSYYADDTLEETVLSCVKSGVDFPDVNFDSMLEAFRRDMRETYGTNTDVVLTSSLDNSALTKKLLSVLSVNLLSNESNPVAVYKNLNPYAFYEYSELTFARNNEFEFESEQIDLNLDKTDFAALGAYAGDEGFYARPESEIAITKQLNGVHYRINIGLSMFNNPSPNETGTFETEDTATLYCIETFGMLRFKENIISGYNHSGRAMKFTNQDIVSFGFNESGEGIFRLKGVNSNGFEFRFANGSNKTNLLFARSVSVEIPDMTVAEVREKANEVVMQFTYSDGGSIELTGSECDLSEIYTFTPTGERSENLEYYLESANAGDITLNLYLEECRVSASYTLTPLLAYSEFGMNVNLPDEYFELQSYTSPEYFKIYDYYYNRYSAYSMQSASTSDRVEADAAVYAAFAEQCQSLIDGGYGEKTATLARAGMASPEKCDVYTFTVKEDTVEYISVKLSPLFGGIIVGEPVDLTDCFVEATLSHGQQRDIPLTNDMLGYYSETTGEQDVEVSYRQVTDTVTMQVRAVKSFDVEEGLDKYYILNDDPVFTDVWLKVTFTDNQTDYVRLSDERAEQISLDLSSAGTGSVTLTFGGVNKNFSYSVIEGVYISYTESAGKITLSRFNMGKPAEGALAWIPQDVKNIILPEEIEGVPVTAIAANLFKGQTILRTLTVPASITTVGYGLVDGCSNLEKLTLSGAIPLNRYFAQYKAATMATSRVFPDIPQKMVVYVSGESLCDNFFEELHCGDSGKYVPKLAFGENILSLGEQDVYEMQSVKAFADGGSQSVYVDGNVIYTDGGATLAYYCAYKADKKFTIPNGVTKASMTSSLLEELTIPACVTTLGEEFMNNADELTTVKFAAGSQVTAIPDNSFGNCSKLTVFNFPENLVSIGRYAMCGVGLERIILPGTVTTIGDTAFNSAKCTHFYLPTGATQSFITSYTSLFITMNNLQAVAYDGSVSISKLPMFKDTLTRQSVKLYITGEQTNVSDKWYWNYANSKISTVYVCSEVTDFYKNYYSGTVVNNYTDKWWLE